MHLCLHKYMKWITNIWAILLQFISRIRVNIEIYISLKKIKWLTMSWVENIAQYFSWMAKCKNTIDLCFDLNFELWKFTLISSIAKCVYRPYLLWCRNTLFCLHQASIITITNICERSFLYIRSKIWPWTNVRFKKIRFYSNQGKVQE